MTEAMITQITTSGMSNRILPMMPPTSISGMNAATVVSDEASTGASIRLAPSRAEARGAPPAWRFESASSPTTIASSTMMPKAMMRANRLTMLMLPPSPQSTPSAAMNETGMPDRDPERDPGVEKQVQHRDHQDQAPRAVLEQQHGPFPNQLPRLVVGVDLHPGRPLAAPSLEPLVENAGGFETVRLLRHG